jgi:tetratricopeptide (TPR) repeat protein
MKLKTILSVILVFSQIGLIAQYVSTFVPQNLEFYQRQLEKKQASYDYNQQYINNIIKWIYELKSQTTEDVFLKKMDHAYQLLRGLDGTDLSVQGDYIRDIELWIREEIESHNKRINESNDPAKYWNIANELLANNEYDKAIPYYDNVEKLSPDFDGTFLNRGFCYASLGFYSNALADYNKFIRLSSSNSEGFKYRGYLYYSMQDYQNCVNDLNNYIKFVKTDADTYSLKGWANYYCANYINAISDFSDQISLEPTNAIAYYNRGTAKSGQKDFYGAVNDYKKSIDLDPSNSMAYNNLGWAYFELKDNEQALKFVNKAIELDPNNYTAIDSRAEIKFALKDYYSCINDCLSVISINSKYANSYFIMGRANYRLGNKSDACTNWSNAGSYGKNEAYEYISKYCTN